MLDYMTNLNLITLGRFLTIDHTFTNLALFAAELALLIRKAEEESKMKLEILILKAQLGETPELTVNDIEDLGVLTTVFRGIFTDDSLTKAQQLAKCKTAGIFGKQSSTELFSQGELRAFFSLNEDDDTPLDLPDDFKETLQESGIRGILTTVLELITHFPSKFVRAGNIAVEFFKKINPLLTGINAASSIINHATRLTRWMASKIFGSTDTRTWLQLEMKDKESPIHKAVVLYIEYNHAIAHQSSGIDTNQTRIEFYKTLTLCDDYAQQNQKFDYYYLQFKDGLEKGFNKPPVAVPRPFEPTTLYLYGSAGVGKSTFWKAIVAPVLDLNDADTLLADIEACTHTWNAASEYQPGMSTKKVILFDDFGQDRSNVDEQMNLIALATTAPYPIDSPNITGIEIKGMMANPTSLVLCSNLTPQQSAEMLASSEALERRVDLGFEILKRFDSADPEAAILRIQWCPRYKHLIGQNISLGDARSLYYVIHHMKRADFTNVQQVVSKEAVKELPLKLPKFLTNRELAENDV